MKKTKKPLIPDKGGVVSAIQTCMAKTVMFRSRQQRVLSSILIITMVHLCARFRSALPSGFSKPQANYWMDFRSIIKGVNYSFIH